MNTKFRRILLITLSLALIAQMAMSVNSYPRLANRDCIGCHNEPLMTGYDGSTYGEDGVLDGQESESFYKKSGTLYVPVSSVADGEHNFEFTRTKIGQNETHLFVSMRVHDEDYKLVGNDNPYYGMADKAAILWNHNASTINKAYPDGMANSYGFQEGVDLWMWAPTEDESYTAVGDEELFIKGSTHDGLYMDGQHFADKENDVMGGGSYVPNTHGGTMDLYVEFARKLDTKNFNDVQFNVTGWYEFSIAIWLGENGNHHHVSFSHYVYIVAPGDAGVAEVAGTETKTVQIDDNKYSTNTVTEEVMNNVTVTVPGVVTVNDGNTSTKDDGPVDSTFMFLALGASAFIAIYARRRK